MNIEEPVQKVEQDKQPLYYSDWYEHAIEPEVRTLVRNLRDRGINTTCSCGHEMFVQGDIDDIQYDEWIITTTLLDMGYDDFEINYTRTIGPAANYFRFEIRIKGAQGRECKGVHEVQDQEAT